MAARGARADNGGVTPNLPTSITVTPSRLAAVICACMLLLSACSMPRLIYSQADWLLLREVNDYLDLDDAQSTQLAAAIAMGMRQHRVQELPDIGATLRDFAVYARDGLRPAQVHAGIERVRALALRSAELGVPALSDALANLTPQQRAHLARRFDERNAKYAERHALDASQEVRLERRARRTVERIEDWTGPLLPEQVALVHAIRGTMPDVAAHWLAYARSRQRALLAQLDAGAPARDIGALLRRSWLHQEDLPPALAAPRERQIAVLVELLVRLDATLDSTQRAHLVGRLEDYARDADSLSRET